MIECFGSHFNDNLDSFKCIFNSIFNFNSSLSFACQSFNYLPTNFYCNPNRN